MSGGDKFSPEEGGAQVIDVNNYINQPADKYGNDESLELQWAMKAYHHAETYFNLVCAIDPSLLKLTRIDETIYKLFREDFPDLDVAVVSDDILKSKEAKEKWRSFCNEFEGRVEDFNMGTLLRLDCTKDTSEDNTTLVPRVQFLAVEITRNREGLNKGLQETYGKKMSEESASAKINQSENS